MRPSLDMCLLWFLWLLGELPALYTCSLPLSTMQGQVLPLLLGPSDSLAYGCRGAASGTQPETLPHPPCYPTAHWNF